MDWEIFTHILTVQFIALQYNIENISFSLEKNLHQIILRVEFNSNSGPPTQKNSGLLTQKLLAASNGELYTAMKQYSNLGHTKNDSRRIILTQVMSDHIIETTSVTPQ